MEIVPEYHFNGFKRQRGKQVVAEYVVVDQSKLTEANFKHFPDVSEASFVQVDPNMMDDYMEIMRVCKTHIAHPEVFELCRRIEHLINEVLRDRFSKGQDRWLFEEKPLPLRSEEGQEDVT